MLAMFINAISVVIRKKYKPGVGHGNTTDKPYNEAVNGG